MSRRVLSVAYSVPVQVLVDMGTGQVQRVVVIDEAIEQVPDGYTEWSEAPAGTPAPTEADIRQAYTFADDDEWPSWDFGF